MRHFEDVLLTHPSFDHIRHYEVGGDVIVSQVTITVATFSLLDVIITPKTRDHLVCHVHATTNINTARRVQL